MTQADTLITAADKSIWSPEESSCRLFAGMSFKVYFAKMGYTDNPQNYIVKVEKTGVQETWKYTRTDNQP